MKRLLLLFVGGCVAVSAFATWKPVFVGHRGGYTGVQNTVEAYTQGVEKYGYGGLECDVRVTADKQYVICHDETTNSIGGSLTVATSTLAQLQAENYSQTRGGVTYTGKICTVSDYLHVCKVKGVIPVIELKWSTGINDNDMTNFPGLMQLVVDSGLANKAIFLTSMKKSLEYIRTNYPTAQVQFLTGQYWANHFDWCVTWKINPSIQSGYFDIHTTKKFHDAGLQVAMWTVNDQANYQKYGDMGVYMMTCDYLYPNQMPELNDVDWVNIPDIVSPLDIEINTVWSYTGVKGNLPTGFPLGGGTNVSAQQAAVVDGVFYTNNYTTSTLLAYDRNGEVTHAYASGSNGHGIACDDAGNLIMKTDGVTASPSSIMIFKKGSTSGITINFSLLDPAQANFLFASGDIFSSEGGFVYIYPNGLKRINILKIANGALVSVSRTQQLSIAGSTAGVILPINNDTTNFVYQVRANGYYRYNGGNKGDYLTGSASTTAPARNSSLGGAFFVLQGHELLVYGSGTNYNGGFSIKDMSSTDKSVLGSVAPLGSAAYAGNPSTGSFFKAEQIDDNAYYLYEYCMGNGYACYEVRIKGTGGTTDTHPAETFRIVGAYPNPTYDVVTISCSEPINRMRVYNLMGQLLIEQPGNCEQIETFDLGGLASGIYLIRVNDKAATRVVKR